jgi:1-acyl-sn-glycerol-3-phosphate acyltransferase
MGVAVTGAFHCQPENVTYNLKIPFRWAHAFVYCLFRVMLYGKIDTIHCPSPFAARELRKHKYNARLHIISNGILPCFKPSEQAPASAPGSADGKFHIMTTGRLAPEKKQELLIKAVAASSYADKIQLHIIGRGPMLKKCMKLGAKLPNPPEFVSNFIPQEELIQRLQCADLYVHTSDVELESLACLEAISCGVVPVISDSETSAASQFALDDRSLFKKHKYLDLRDKIDWWIEHPEEITSMKKRYVEESRLFMIDESAKKMDQMFYDAVRDNKTEKLIKEDKRIKRYNNKVKNNNLIKDFFCDLIYFIIFIPGLIVWNRIFYGLKIVGKKNLKKIRKSGAISICNHVHEMDSTFAAISFPHRKLIYVSLPRNFQMKVAGVLVNALGAVPSPSTPKELQSFIYTLSKFLRKGRIVHIFPEGELIRYGKTMRPFQRGAFYLACDASVPVLPMRIIYRKPKGLYKLYKKKPCLTLVIGEPVYPNYSLLDRDAVADIQNRSEQTMQSLAA